MLKAATALRRGIAFVATAMGVVAGWGFVLCAFFIAFEVLARAFLHVTTGSTVEISGYMLAFGLSWGLAHTLTERGHVRIDVLINRMPRHARVPLHLLSLGLSLLLSSGNGLRRNLLRFLLGLGNYRLGLTTGFSQLLLILLSNLLSLG
jgi:TRAP-type mannitol/chloroaromatic compound transport system permease small subunit